MNIRNVWYKIGDTVKTRDGEKHFVFNIINVSLNEERSVSIEKGMPNKVFPTRMVLIEKCEKPIETYRKFFKSGEHFFSSFYVKTQWTNE